MVVMTGRVTMLDLSRWADSGGSYRMVQRFSLNLSEFVDGCSQSMMEGVCSQKTLLFARDWLENGGETPLASASVYALQIALN